MIDRVTTSIIDQRAHIAVAVRVSHQFRRGHSLIGAALNTLGVSLIKLLTKGGALVVHDRLNGIGLLF